MGEKGYQKRLNNIIVSDNSDSVCGLEKLVKSEIINVLQNYFIISLDDIDIDLSSVIGGRYKITISGDIRGVKKIKKII